ncbi:hypothetical protein QR680_003144 [Steinernema hermaphroditum]|uniref:Uncharacterized protein n=1 Tax=Steinernema hermaphroditum TaxID=289476 RepID=A0AA39H5J0_9BILA|nr:hypothetical protein QR680_003144 [Steinernema hermaphroditum]
MEQAEESDLASAQPTLAPRAVYQRRQRNYVSMSGRQPFRRAAPPGSEDESSDSSESSSSEEDEDEFGRLLRRVQMRLPKIDRSAHVAVPLVTVPEQPQPSAAPCAQPQNVDAMEKIKAEHAVVELTRSIQKLEFDKNELHSARANVFEMEDAARRDDPTTYATAMEYVWATDTKTRTSSETQTVD